MWAERDENREMVTLRTATVDDAAALASLAAMAFVATFGPHNPQEAIDGYVAEAFALDTIASQIADQSSTWVIADDADGPAGFAHLVRDDAPTEVAGAHPIHLERLYARPDRVGTGIGAALMQDCLDRATAAGCDSMWLGVWEHNERAIGFYERWSFTPVGEIVFRLGDDDQTDLVYQRLL